MPLTAARRIPVATYRLQLRREFPFTAAAALVPQLHDLGVTDCYLSPFFLSSPGSSHGYDVNDYRRIDPELGGRAGLERLHAELRPREMGLLLDFVPNHMGINGPESMNRWWRDVLENGQLSPYARYFDINWSGNSTDGRPRVLVPVLDDHYGRVLEQGRLTLNCEAGTLSIAFGEMTLPVAPQTYRTVLAPLVKDDSANGKEILALADAFAALPKPAAAEGGEAAKVQPNDSRN